MNEPSCGVRCAARGAVPCGREGPRERFMVQEVGCHLRARVPGFKEKGPETYHIRVPCRTRPTDTRQAPRRNNGAWPVIPCGGPEGCETVFA